MSPEQLEKRGVSSKTRIVRLRARRLPPQGQGADGAAPRNRVEVWEGARGTRAAPARLRSASASAFSLLRVFDEAREHAVAEEDERSRRRVLPRGAGARESVGGGGGGCRRRQRLFFAAINDSIEKASPSPLPQRCCCCSCSALSIFEAIAAVARFPARARARHRDAQASRYKGQIDTTEE